MSEFFKTSTTWVVDFHYNGHPRRWFKLLRSGQDAQALMIEELRALYGARAQLVDVRVATSEEESQYLRGETAGNALCANSRATFRSAAERPAGTTDTSSGARDRPAPARDGP
jgi:hypothetical protein